MNVTNQAATRVTIVIPFLNLGGTQRVVTSLANTWVENGKQVTIITLGDRSVPPFFPLSPSVNWVALGKSGSSTNFLSAILANIRRIFALRAAIRRNSPEVVVSFLTSTNVLTIAATRGLHVPLVISERTDPYKDYLSKAWLLLRRITYPAAQHLVVLSAHYIEFFKPMLNERITSISNPAYQPPQLTQTGTTFPPGKVIISIGRLSYEKGYDLLIQAFALICKQHPDWNLLILGEGSMRKELEDLSVSLGLNGRVYLPGAVKDPYNYLYQSSLYVLPSRIEGFGLVLCEAMACGLAVVAFNCSAQTSEIVRDRIDGVLVSAENVQLLASAMSDIMADDSKRRLFAENAREILNRFPVSRIMKIWEEVLDKAVANNRKEPRKN
jgi:GalNAc-alpha-(1->4)-GalNAc-alpha-(1->3)-diNAcBac-PP-undecaprenol alpha-1,4-N-acetyl-D-galactosaminyltransferase